MKKLVLIAVIGGLWSTPSPAPVKNGNGGDDVRLMVTQSRELAARRVANLKSCGFRDDASADTRAWILGHQAEMAADILASSHSWVDGPQPNDEPNTCARTNLTERAEVQFSIEACHSTVTSYSAAGMLLVHESVHHFGIADETLADAVALAVYGSSVVPGCSASPAPQIAIGYNEVCALKADQIRCLDDGAAHGTIIEGLNHPYLVRGDGYGGFCATDDDGVKCWDRLHPLSLSMANFDWRDLSLTSAGSCAAAPDRVSCWGRNQALFGLENDDRLDHPRRIALGRMFACALQEGGVLCSSDGHFPYPPEPPSDVPLDAAYDLQAGEETLCALIGGSIRCWSTNGPDFDTFHLRQHPLPLHNITQMGLAGTLCVGGDGLVICRLSNGSEGRYTIPNLRQIAASLGKICIVDGDRVKCAGSVRLDPLTDITDALFSQ